MAVLCLLFSAYKLQLNTAEKKIKDSLEWYD